MLAKPAKNQPSDASPADLSTADQSNAATTQTKSEINQKSLDKYLQNLEKTGSSQATVRNYRSDIGQFIEFFQQQPEEGAAGQEPQQAVENFVASQRKKGLAEATVRRKSVSVSQFLQWLNQPEEEEKNELPEESQAGEQTGPQPKTKKTDYLIPMEIEGKLNEYLTVLTYNSAAEATIRNYRSDVKQLAYFAKAKTLSQLLTLENLKQFALSEKKKGLKATSIQRKLVSITQFATWAQRKKLVSNVSADWPSMVMDAIFSDGSGPIILKTPEVEPIQLAKKGRKREGLLAAVVLLLLLFGSSIGLFLVQTVQEIRQQASTGTTTNTTSTASGLSEADYQSLLSMIEGEHVVPFNGKLYRSDNGEQITGQAIAFFQLLNSPDENGEVVWESGACQIETDIQGIYNVNLGSGNGDGNDVADCGAPLTNDIFYGNSNLWLSTIIGGDQLALYPIKTVSYSQNSDLLGGVPLGDPVINDSVLYQNEDGEIVFADPPTFNVTQGDLTLAGENLYFVTEGRGSSIFDNLINAPGAVLGGTGNVPLTLRRKIGRAHV